MLSCYAGIGSRSTPDNIITKMVNYGKVLARLGLVLRSGAADGADKAFERGCDFCEGKKEIYLPWKGFNSHPSELHTISRSALEYAKDIYGYRWTQLKQSTKLLMARNMYQVLGQTLDHPADFVLCWTPDGCTKKEQRTATTGGTGQAIACASELGIPIFNLYNQETEDELQQFLIQRNYDNTTGC